MGRVTIPNGIEVIVASFGGVGTSFLIDFLSKHRKTNQFADYDGLKHSALPPISFNKKIKLVYIYGDPQLAAISLFRRDYQHYQSAKLQKFTNGKKDIIPLGTSLQEYAADGIDKFKFREHFYNWYDEHLVHPTFFVKYEKIFDVVEPLLEFLEIPKEYISDFPQKKKRNSSIESIPEETQKNISAMYDKFRNELSEIADYEIRYPSEYKPELSSYMKPIYIYALFRQFPNVLLHNILKLVAGKPLQTLEKVAPPVYRYLRHLMR